jgi:hypothetical protein
MCNPRLAIMALGVVVVRPSDSMSLLKANRGRIDHVGAASVSRERDYYLVINPSTREIGRECDHALS